MYRRLWKETRILSEFRPTLAYGQALRQRGLRQKHVLLQPCCVSRRHRSRDPCGGHSVDRRIDLALAGVEVLREVRRAKIAGQDRMTDFDVEIGWRRIGKNIVR